MNVKIVTDNAELFKCFEIVYNAYRSKGYCPTKSQPLHYTLWQLVPEAVTALIYNNKEIIGTATSVLYTEEMKLPSFRAFSTIIKSLTHKFNKIAEVTSLATKYPDKEAIFSLMAFGMYYAIDNNIDMLLITVNPSHVNFYEKVLQFSKLSYSPVIKAVGAPGVLLGCIPSTWNTRMEKAAKKSKLVNSIYTFIKESANEHYLVHGRSAFLPSTCY